MVTRHLLARLWLRGDEGTNSLEEQADEPRSIDQSKQTPAIGLAQGQGAPYGARCKADGEIMRSR